MFVRFDEMVGHYCREQLWRSDLVLLGQYVDSLLHRIRSNDHAVIGFGITLITLSTARPTRRLGNRLHSRSLNCTFKQHTHRHFDDTVGSTIFITVDFVDTDVILAILSRRERRHRFDPTIIEIAATLSGRDEKDRANSMRCLRTIRLN